MTDSNYDTAGIAIIGMSGRFPGARNLSEFWQNLREGRESISTLDEATLLAEGVEPSALADPTYVRASPILEGIDLFDAPLFDISPAEARLLDPQHRLFLECSWEALEHGGYRSAAGELSIGVFGSSTTSSYMLNNLMHLPAIRRARNGLNMQTLQVFVANDKDYLATRVAFKLDLRGPSYTVQSACSSSLVAFQVACQALLARECDLALAGGASIKVPQRIGYYHEPGSIVSSDGHCRAFDAKGDGTVFGSGVGVVLLRRLEDALASGDHIWAIVRGGATNNDGSLKMGFTAPSVEAQARVIEEAINVAGVTPDSISYIEAHGTGTNLGDPVEIAALTQAFRTGTQRKKYCRIGSVKTNIGHLEGTSGIAGVIKTALMLHHKEIPASLHFEVPNPELDLENSPFVVNTELRSWTTLDGAPRRAGVTSLGVGGTNAHVVLEEAPARPRQAPAAARPWQMLTLSAHAPASLDAATVQLSTFLKEHREVDLADVAYTLNVGRAELRYRRVLVCRDADDAQSVLSGAEPARLHTTLRERLNPPVVFMFGGQGTQYSNMGLELLKTEATFRSSVDRCAEILRPVLGQDIRSLIYPDASRLALADAELRETVITQPALFVIEYALARTWMALGVTPSVLMGHSVGELVAACIASVFTLEDALHLVALRGRLVQELPHGAMLSVALSPSRLEPYLSAAVSVAAVNEPTRTVLSGTLEAIDACAQELTRGAIEHRRLRTSHAFHSAMLDVVMDRFASAVAKVKRSPPVIRCLSNVSGTWLTDEQAQDPSYWGAQLRRPVRFAENLTCVLSEGPAVLLEVGPGRTLTRFAQASPSRKSDHIVVHSMRHASETTSDSAVLLQAVGQLWMHGVPMDWKKFWKGEQRRREPLPTYSFDLKRYWIDPVGGAWSQSAATGDPASAAGAADAAWPPAARPGLTGEERPNVSTLFAPARTATESVFVEIWNVLLGIRNVGIYDNFFELGGDSVLGVQVASRANACGLRVSPKHLFDYQCIAELAAAVDAGVASRPMVSEEVHGPQPLLPNQRWLLERMPEFESWVSITVLESRDPVDIVALEETVQALRAHHSALFTRFVELPSGWVQEVVSASADQMAKMITCVDLSDAAGQEFHARVDECARQASREVDLKTGEVFRVFVVRGNAGAGKNDRLILAIHHWVQDQWGERVLMHDLEAAYAQRRAGESIQFLPTATSMSALAATLARLAGSAAADPESREWLRPTRAAVRQLPFQRPPTLTRSLEQIVGVEDCLNESDTSLLLGALQRTRRVTLEEVTICAGMSALAEWSGERSLLADVLMSARQVDVAGVDLTRSIGWFSTIHPLHIDLTDATTPIARLDATVHAMRAVRHREHEYGMLRYMSSDPSVRARLAEMPQADVFFAYFGNLDAPEAGYAREVGDGPFRVDPAATDMKRTMMGAFRYAVEIVGYVRAGRLHVAWLFNESLLSSEARAQIVASCMRDLRALAAGDSATSSVQDRTPEFSEPGLAPEQLHDILAELTRSSDSRQG
jgi:non-ribosomal peptide synthase protein (TIGR01720 family)